MSSTEAAATGLPNFKDFPSYIPVHADIKVNTDSGSLLLLRELDEKLQKIKDDAESLIEYASERSHLVQNDKFQIYCSNTLKSYEQIYSAKVKLQALQLAMKNTHRELVEGRRSTLTLTLSNYDSCKELMKRNFADSFSENLDELLLEKLGAHLEGLLHRDPAFSYIKNALFVLQNPEDPLQDEQVDEELAVEGGKISLKDPLSLNYYSDPVVSKKCMHVFEREHIVRQIRATREKYACPVTGCNACLTESDLSPDKLMKLRVKVYMGRANKREHESVVRI